MSEKLTDEQTAEQFIWLTNTAGAQLQELAGGAPQTPVFDGASLEYLRQIADTANALADHHGGEVKEAEKVAKEQEKADAKAAAEADKQAKADEKAAEKPKNV